MSNIQRSFQQIDGSVLVPMQINSQASEVKGNCWESNFSDEFPISNVNNKGDEATVIVGPPHLDYKIITHLKNQKMDGESTLLSDKNVLVANLTFVDGIANGPCTIYDEWNSLYFEGSFVNGYRQGKGKEYEKEKLVYEGLYEKGKKLVKMTEMEGYWKEYDNSKNLQSVCKKDDEGKNNGVCFFYENGEISRLSEWHEGRETPYNGYFKLFDETDRKWIEGEYKDGVRNGESREYDENGGMMFEGYYENGKKLNMVRLDEMDGYWKEYDDDSNLKSICKKDKEGRYEGICYFYENGTMTRVSEWHVGREYPFIGYFKLFDEPHSKWIDGFYNEGRILHFSPMAEMDGYWKEYDDSGSLIHICKIDDKGNYNGICYIFENGILQGICRWEEGDRKVPYNGYYKVYDTVQNQWMEGYYENGKKLNMVRLDEMDGYWKEYDDDSNLKSICKKDKEGRYEGICYFYENGTMTRVSEWHEGTEVSLNGRCKFFDEPHKVWYEGGFRNGLCEGKYIEYDVSGKKKIEGVLKNGKKLISLNNMKDYWEERDKQNNIVRICQIDTNGRYDGLCYQYRENQIIRVSRWKEDREIEILKEFNNGIMTEYIDGNKIYSGGYIPSLRSNYQRQGEGKEYELDGKTLLYEGSFINGKRDGYGTLYKHEMIAYEGEWKKGMKKSRYILYIILSLAFLFLTSVASFLLFNAYVGAIISGIYITAICFYNNKYAGIIASGLFIVMCCFFSHLYAGIIASVVFAITTAFCVNLYAGYVSIGLVIAAVSLYLNTYVGIYAIGLFLIYLIYLTVHCSGWKKSIYYTSTVYILSLCTILSFLLIYDNIAALKYTAVFAIGILLILILSLIAGCKKETINPLISCAMMILIACTIISLLIQTVQPSYTKYIVISLVGLLLICIANLIAFEYGWSTIIVLKSAVVIVVGCIIITTAIGSFSVPGLRYVSVFASGLLLMIIVFYITGYNKEKIHLLISSFGLIMSCCILASLLLSSMNFATMKYYLVFLIGMILFFLIYLLVSIFYENFLNIVPVSLCIILVVCGLTDLLIASYTYSVFRHITVYVIGILLIIAISFFTEGHANSMHIVISSSGLIVCCCIAASFIISSISISSIKYYLVFLIGVGLFFMVYFISALCNEAEERMPALLCIILGICSIIDLIMASIEIYVMRHVTVLIFGFVLNAYIFKYTDYGDKNPHVLISGVGFVTFLCYIICWLFGASGKLFIKYYVVAAICSCFVFMVYFFISLCDGEKETVGECAGYAFWVSFVLELLMGSADNVYVRCITIYLFGTLLCIEIIGRFECTKEVVFYSVILVFIAVFICSWISMNVGGEVFIIVQILWTITWNIVKFILSVIILIACCIAMGSN